MLRSWRRKAGGLPPNYRGSDQIAQRLSARIVNDAGAGPAATSWLAVEAVKQRGFVDRQKIAVCGWSYGGYMTTWRSATIPAGELRSGAAVTDWIDQYSYGNTNVRRGAAFGGSPWTDPKRMQANMEQSPIAYRVEDPHPDAA